MKMVFRPVILAQPAIEGTIAGRLPTDVICSTRPRNNEPMMLSWMNSSPSLRRPVAAQCAIRAEVPVPQGDRSIAFSP